MQKLGKTITISSLALGLLFVLPAFLIVALGAKVIGETALLVSSLVALGGGITILLSVFGGIVIWLAGKVIRLLRGNSSQHQTMSLA